MKSNKSLVDLDPEWSKEETDYLMDLCQQYNMRFILITDRYSYQQKSRSMEVCVTRSPVCI